MRRQSGVVHLHEFAENVEIGWETRHAALFHHTQIIEYELTRDLQISN